MRSLLSAFLLSLLAIPAWADVFSFETPSGNIQCSVGLSGGGSDIICDIVQKTGVPPLPRPPTCTQAWGHRFSMLERGFVQMECAPFPQDFEVPEKAPYGVTGSWGGIRCLSETTGLQCQNADGHGFFLSRRVQTVY